jgi:hypothetical protein
VLRDLPIHTCLSHRRTLQAAVRSAANLLQSLLAAALTRLPPWLKDAIAAALPRDRLVDLWEKLCAIPIEDRSLADVIQNVLSEQYNEDDLRRIAEVLDSATGSVQDLDRLWPALDSRRSRIRSSRCGYSGLRGSGHNVRVLAYEKALAWWVMFLAHSHT